jgi:hypothetical protein
MDKISQDAFRENLNTKFVANGAVDLDLVECKDLGSTPQQEQFSIVFRGPREPRLEQMTYEMKHDVLGETLIFLVPIRQDAESLYYEAVFNRFVEEPK